MSWGDNSGLSGWIQCNHKGPYPEPEERIRKKGAWTQQDIADFKDGGRCHEQSLKAGKCKKTDPPLKPPKENGALLTPSF